jgi:hypothetical protein
MSDVRTQDTIVTSAGVPLAVRVHRSAAAGWDRQPAVVAMGSWLTVKEQMPDLYAGRLAAAGFTALTFDFAGFGASGGEPAQTELPVRKMADLAAVVDAARSMSWVDPDRIGVVAVCASAQYTLGALARGLPVGAFAAVAGWFHDLATADLRRLLPPPPRRDADASGAQRRRRAPGQRPAGGRRAGAARDDRVGRGRPDRLLRPAGAGGPGRPRSGRPFHAHPGKVLVNDAVTASIVRFFRAIDTRDWNTVRGLLADEVVLDYVSLFGGEVETVAADEVVERWRALLPGFDATQHVLGVLAELDGTVQTNVRGYHVLGDEVWMAAGWYRLALDGGDPARIAGIVLTATYETGDRELVGRARARAAL